MGQVPRYGIIGSGRLARHLSEYFRLLSIPFISWSRRGGKPPEEILSSADVLLLAISDRAIEPFIREHSRQDHSRQDHSGARHGLAAKRWIHFSGSLSSELAGGMHPLMTFGSDLYPLATYERIPFFCDFELSDFRDLFPGLRNPVHHLPKELKARYHALCVLSGNFSVLLWRKFFSELEERFGVKWTEAVPYLEQMTRNLAENPDTALTGPLMRGDFETLRRDLGALRGDPFEGIFESFVQQRSHKGAKDEHH